MEGADVRRLDRPTYRYIGADADLGERVHAIVDAASPVTAQELQDHVAQLLVRYKVPRTVELVHEPLRDDAGKVRRSALRAARLEGPDARRH